MAGRDSDSLINRRFAFGRNWQGFSRVVDEERISQATRSLQELLARKELRGMTFLDIGCGCGVFSLAARNMGARVHAFDYDADAVACAKELKRKYREGDADWVIERGSVLDRDYIDRLGRFDVVYSWGVLHHTGDMGRAIENAQVCVDDGGKLFIAIYNDQGWISRYWTLVKRAYNSNWVFRWLVFTMHVPYFCAYAAAKRLVRGRVRRGMSIWYDMFDWLGGYPFEVSRPENVIESVRQGGLELRSMTTCGGKGGCNEFVFQKVRQTPANRSAA